MNYKQIFFLFLILALICQTNGFWFPWFGHKTKDSSSEEGPRQGHYGHSREGLFGRKHHHKHHNNEYTKTNCHTTKLPSTPNDIILSSQPPSTTF